VARGAVLFVKEASLHPHEVASNLKPHGAFDSLYGATVEDGGALTYDELVVYTPSAAVPSYLIIYQFD